MVAGYATRTRKGPPRSLNNNSGEIQVLCFITGVYNSSARHWTPRPNDRLAGGTRPFRGPTRPMAFAEMLQQTALARWIGESGSLWGYPTILFLHTLGLAA